MWFKKKEKTEKKSKLISALQVEKKKMMFRQGDVLIRRSRKSMSSEANEIPRDEQNRVVLAHGEVTGHAHAIHNEGVIAFMMGDVRYIEVPKLGAEVVHEEHDTIELDQGTYEVVQQREWTGNDQSKQWIYVAD